MPDYQLPEGWKNLHKSPVVDTEGSSENSAPINSVGQPQLDKHEIVIEDGTVRSRQYFIIQCENGKVKAIVPGVKDNKDYVGPEKKTRQDALQDAFNVLNTQPPKDHFGAVSRRTPDKAQTIE
jgi:hypothetical protein